MSDARLTHERARCADRAKETAQAEIGNYRAARILNSELSRAGHVQLAERALTFPICDYDREQVQSLIVWMKAAPNRCLTERQVRALVSMIRKAFALKCRGETWTGEPVFGRTAKQRPAWMSDPSLLPKAPPGRVL